MGDEEVEKRVGERRIWSLKKNVRILLVLKF